MLKTNIVDGTGTGNKAHVTADNALKVSQSNTVIPPPVGTQNVYRYYSEYLANEVGGSTDMAVDGSSVPQVFSLDTIEDADIYIMYIGILIADSAVSHDDFGGVSALSVGFDLYAIESGETTYFIEKAKTSGQLIVQSGFNNPYSSTQYTWELTNWTGNQDAHTVSIPISDYVPGGIRLGRGGYNTITAKINDDITGLTEMRVKVFGYKHYDIGG